MRLLNPYTGTPSYGVHPLAEALNRAEQLHAAVMAVSYVDVSNDAVGRLRAAREMAIKNRFEAQRAYESADA